ncbi:MAG: type II secretion system protein [Epsilonproteobacteria bacterium]|nr:type II secretion system protein [Campylobacterota bacterium]
MKKLREAFTFIEVIIVMVLLGILASLAISANKRDLRQEAILHMLTMIRYTQFLAIHDNQYENNDTRWLRKLWRFGIYKCSGGNDLYYIIGSDKDKGGNIDLNEAATDPSNQKKIYWNGSRPCPKGNMDEINWDVSPNMFITRKYGISNVKFEGGCTSSHVGFDHIGRAYSSFTSVNSTDHSKLIKSDCKITFSFKNSSFAPFSIIIKRESGYAYLENNPNI